MAPHPILLLRRLGAGDFPVALALTLVLVLQGAMLLEILRRFVIGGIEAGFLVLPIPCIISTAMITFGTIGLACHFILMERRRDRVRHSMEIPDLLPSLRHVPGQLTRFDHITGCIHQIQLCYHLQYETACYTIGSSDKPRIVLGKGFGSLSKRNPPAAEFVLAHEYAHIEVGATSGELRVRLLLKGYFIILGGIVASLATVMAYLRPTFGTDVTALGTTYNAKIVEILPALDRAIMIQLVTPLIIVGVGGAAVFVFSYFYLVRRELLHDLRAAQITGNSEIGAELHQAECLTIREKRFPARWWHALKCFFGCHPTGYRRIRSLMLSDSVLINTDLYPFLIGAVLPPALLAIERLNPSNSSTEEIWTVVSTALIGILIALEVRADIVRFAIAWIRRFWTFLVLVARYGTMMGLGSALLGSVFALWFTYRFQRPWSLLPLRIARQLLISGRTTLFFVVLIAISSYMAAVRLCRSDPDMGSVVRTEAAALCMVSLLAFFGFSLNTREYVLSLAAVMLVSVIGWLGIMTITSNCSSCGSRRPEILLLRSRCGICGHVSPLTRNLSLGARGENLPSARGDFSCST